MIKDYLLDKDNKLIIISIKNLNGSAFVTG